MKWLRALPQDRLAEGWEQGSRVLIRHVCQACQQHLNTAFENSAKPLLVRMLDGSAIELTPTQQVIVGRWTAKTALMLGLNPRNEHVTAEGRESLRLLLREVMQSGAPPPSATVRLAYLSDSRKPSEGMFLRPGWADPSLYEFVSIISVPGLLCETVIHVGPSAAELIDVTKDDDRFLSVWPRQAASADWPPRRPLALLDAGQFRHEWGQPVDTVKGNFPDVFDAILEPKDAPADGT